MDSTFDPQAFMETAIEGDFNDKITPFPEVNSCFATIERIDLVSGTAQSGAEWTKVNFTFKTDDEEVKRISGLQNPRVRLQMFLDMVGSGDARRLATKSDDPNSNVRLGRLKDALGMKPGKPFRLGDMQGLGCYIKTKHSSNSNDPENTFCNVVAVSKTAIR